MNAFDALEGWKLKAVCAAIFFGVLGLGVGGLWLSMKATEKDRGLIIASFENVCASVGVPYRLDAAGKPLARKLWGKDCAAKVLKLATDAAGAATASLNTYVAHDADQIAKAATDRPAARRSAARIQTGQQQMETAIDHSQDGHLGPDYFDGLNRSLGLRPYIAPGAADANGGGQGEGQAGRVVDGLQ